MADDDGFFDWGGEEKERAVLVVLVASLSRQSA